MKVTAAGFLVIILLLAVTGCGKDECPDRDRRSNQMRSERPGYG